MHTNRATMDKEYWDKRWMNGETGWDMGGVSTPLKEYIDQLGNKHLRILIPGCGNAWEAQYLWENGFTQTTVVDISNGAVESFSQRFNQFPAAQIICGDFFGLNGKFDLILEQTFFCALNPSQRPEYVSKCSDLLVKGGTVAGVLFDFPLDDGPPFGGDIKEYRKLFTQKFQIDILERCRNSIKPREGREFFFRLTNL